MVAERIDILSKAHQHIIASTEQILALRLALAYYSILLDCSRNVSCDVNPGSIDYFHWPYDDCRCQL